MKRLWRRGKTSGRAAGGFTLIEGMVATAVFAVAVTGTVSMVNSCWGTLRQTQEEVYVNRILESAVETARSLGYQTLRDTMNKDPDTGQPLPTPPRYFDVTPAGVISLFQTPNPAVKSTDFQRELDSASGTILLRQLRPGLIQLSVSVTWRPASSTESETLETVTLITREGVTRA